MLESRSAAEARGAEILATVRVGVGGVFEDHSDRGVALRSRRLEALLDAAGIAAGEVDLLVLSVLAEGNAYGYAIQKRLSEASEGQVDLKAGTLYPLLHRLEDERLIRSKWDTSSGRKRKWYELTRAGRRRLEQDAQQWSRYAKCIMQLLSPVMGGISDLTSIHNHD